jgi:hypothetical protein
MEKRDYRRWVVDEEVEGVGGEDADAPNTSASKSANQKRNRDANEGGAADHFDAPKPKRRRKTKARRKPIYKAMPIEIAVLKQNTLDSSFFGAKREKMNKIAKIIQRAQGPGTGDKEQEAAWFLVRKKAKEIDVPVETIKAWVKNEQEGGISKVGIVRTDQNPNVKVMNQAHVADLANAVSLANKVKTFSTRTGKTIEHSFYGISKKTMAAALMFCQLYNRVTKEGFSRFPKYGERRSWLMGVAKGVLKHGMAEIRGLADRGADAQNKLQDVQLWCKRIKGVEAAEEGGAEEESYDYLESLFCDEYDDDNDDGDNDGDEDDKEDHPSKDYAKLDFDDENFGDIDISDADDAVRQVLLRKAFETQRELARTVAAADSVVTAWAVADDVLLEKDISVPKKKRYRPAPPRDKEAFLLGVKESLRFRIQRGCWGDEESDEEVGG